MAEFFDKEQAVALIIFISAGIGMSCNWFVVAFISKVQSLQNAFGRLTISQALAGAIHLTIFTFFVAPMIFFKVETMENISKYFGHVLLICYDICIYCHTLISLNRMAAVMLPLQYKNIFSMKNANKMTIAVWILTIFPSLYFYQIQDCAFYFNRDEWRFVFKSTPVCLSIGWYTDFVKYVTIVTLIIIIDLLTLFRVHAQNVSSSHNRRSHELNFLNQTCLQGTFFVCELLTYFLLYNCFESRYIKFSFTTLSWICVHSADGFIIVIFNRGFQRIWKKRSEEVNPGIKFITNGKTCMKWKTSIRSTEEVINPQKKF